MILNFKWTLLLPFTKKTGDSLSRPSAFLVHGTLSLCPLFGFLSRYGINLVAAEDEELHLK